MKLNRRAFLGLTTAMTALTVFGIGEARAQDVDTLRMGIAASGPRHSDPNLTTQGSDNWATEQIYEQLVRPEDGKFAVAPEEYVPTLATEWSQSEDAKVWTFKLREGVQFHRGYGEMTSEDVVFSFERAIAEGTNRTILANIESVVANGPYEVTITLSSPT